MTPSLTVPDVIATAVREFRHRELGAPAPTDRDVPAGVHVAAIGTTAARAVQNPQLGEALSAEGLTLAGAVAFGGPGELVATSGWDLGVVLSPYKRAIGELVTEMTGSASRSGVVDTVLAARGRTLGVNTNSWAIAAALRVLAGAEGPERVLILGTGASTRSALLGITRAWPRTSAYVAGRDVAAATAMATDFGATAVSAAQCPDVRAKVVINATTWGETDESERVPFAFPFVALATPGCAFFDLNNRPSDLLMRALDQGCAVMSGTLMQRVTHACRAAAARWRIDG